MSITFRLYFSGKNEALDNIKDAIVGHIQSLKKHSEPIPAPIDEELVEINV